MSCFFVLPFFNGEAKQFGSMFVSSSHKGYHFKKRKDAPTISPNNP